MVVPSATWEDVWKRVRKRNSWVSGGGQASFATGSSSFQESLQGIAATFVACAEVGQDKDLELLPSSDASGLVPQPHFLASSAPTPSAKAFIAHKFSYSFIQSPFVTKNTIIRFPQDLIQSSFDLFFKKYKNSFKLVM